MDAKQISIRFLELLKIENSQERICKDLHAKIENMKCNSFFIDLLTYIESLKANNDALEFQLRQLLVN